MSINPDMFGDTISTIETPLPAALQDVINVNEDFSTRIGSLCHCPAKLYLRNEAEPMFYKPRKLPFAINPVVGDELDWLEQQGVIEKVSHSEWATPIVVVRKPGGKVCIWGDFKVTINPQLKTDVYPLKSCFGL